MHSSKKKKGSPRKKKAKDAGSSSDMSEEVSQDAAQKESDDMISMTQTVHKRCDLCIKRIQVITIRRRRTTNSEIAHFKITLNALYNSALGIGAITFLYLSQLPGEYTTWATIALQRLFHTQKQPVPSQVPIYTHG